MRVDPSIAAKHLEAAAREQVANRLHAEGYQIEREASFAGLPADLVARRGNEFLVYEFKAPHPAGGPDWAQQTAALRTRVAEGGGRFRLVLVRPPRETAVDIHGLEQALAEACARDPELSAMSVEALVREVSNLQIESVRTEPDVTRVSGEATVIVELFNADDEGHAEEILPVVFDVTLDHQGRLTTLHHLKLDLSSWAGSPDKLS
jgi:hypothetical protein